MSKTDEVLVPGNAVAVGSRDAHPVTIRTATAMLVVMASRRDQSIGLASLYDTSLCWPFLRLGVY